MCTLVRIVHTTYYAYYYIDTVGAPGPGNSPSRQGTSDGRRAERASEDTNETKNNVEGEIIQTGIEFSIRGSINNPFPFLLKCTMRIRIRPIGHSPVCPLDGAWEGRRCLP